jgi:hypothetical protein
MILAITTATELGLAFSRAHQLLTGRHSAISAITAALVVPDQGKLD